MSILNHNKTQVTFDVDLTAVTWTKAKDMPQDKEEKVVACGINTKSKFGASAWVVLEGNKGVNLPSYMVDNIKEVLNDSESVEQIKKGQVGIKFSPVTTKGGNTTVSCKWTEYLPF